MKNNRLFVNLLCAVVFAVCLQLLNSPLYSAELAGIRGIQIRSEKVVTVWLGYESTTDMDKLKDVNLYTISSDNDPNYARGVKPLDISRFAKGSHSRDGWGSEDRMDNYMHCNLPYALQYGTSYQLSLGEGLIPSPLNNTITFSINETPNPSFKLNQVGYSNNSQTKLVYLSSYLGDGKVVDLSKYQSFEVRRNSDNITVFTGSIELVSKKDPQGNDELYVIDISLLNEIGEFYIWVEGLGRSYSFLNGSNASNKIFDIISRGFYFQRCGAEVTQPWAGDWERPMAHNKIYVTQKNIMHPWTENITDTPVDPESPSSGDWYVPDGPKEFHGGHYDAGDFDVNLTHVGVGEKLMSLFEALPQNFYDGQCNIPESGNGIPDILDEVSWSLLQWEYCQDYAKEVRGINGGVAPGMESYGHPPVVKGMGHTDPLPYYMRKVTPYSSFAGGGLFAMAARIFKAYNPTKAEKYLERALSAYEWAVENFDMEWNPEMPVDTFSTEEFYDKKMLETAHMWAAGQLFATTGDLDYQNVFIQYYNDGYWNNIQANIFWVHTYWTVLWPMVITNKENVDKTFQNKLKSQLLEKADDILDEINENGRTGYQAAFPKTGTWSRAYGRSSPLHVSNINALVRGYLLSKQQKYKNGIATCLDFVLGMNPSEWSWMTGAGTVYPMDPLNINCKWDGIQEPYPGIVIFGPSYFYNNEHNLMYPEKLNIGFYRRISDIWTLVDGCEYVVEQEMANMYVAAGILLNNFSTHIEGELPVGFHQNQQLFYPNPAKNIININTTKPGYAKIFNMQGQLIRSQKLSVGNSSVSIDNINTGSYVVEVQQGSFIESEILIIE